MLYTFNRHQFVQVLAHVWSSSEYKKWGESDQAFWLSVAEYEFKRVFNEGWGYCDSVLRSSPVKGREWKYTTTSGTEFNVKQEVLIHADADTIPNAEYTVYIPESRKDGNHDSWCQKVSMYPDIVWYSWGDLYYSKPGTPQYLAALNRGVIPKCDRPIQETEDDSSFEDVEEYDFDESDFVDED